MLLLDEGISVKNSLLCLKSFIEYYFARDNSFMTHQKFGMSKKMKSIYYNVTQFTNSELIISKFDYSIITDTDNVEATLHNYLATYVFDGVTKFIHFALHEDSIYIRTYDKVEDIVNLRSLDTLTMEQISGIYSETIRRQPSQACSKPKFYENNLSWIHDNHRMLSMLEENPIIFARNINDLPTSNITK
jgi:hypothetical protein